MGTKSSMRWLLVVTLISALSASAKAKAPGRLGIAAFPPDLAAELKIADGGAAIFQVIPSSPAGKAKLAPGDIIVSLNGKPVNSFVDLSQRVGTLSSGDAVTLELKRGGKSQTKEIVLSNVIGELTPEAHRQTSQYLRTLLPTHPSSKLRREIIEQMWSAGDRVLALKELDEAIRQHPDDRDFLSQRLELYQKVGDYGRYVSESLSLADRYPQSAPLRIHKIEALLATGKIEQAEELARKQATGVGLFGLPATSIQARKLWLVARLRLGKPLGSKEASNRLPPAVHPELALANYWIEKLKDRAPYRWEGKSSGELELARAGVLMGLAPYAMHGIRVKINGVEVPLAIVDTGASHTLVSTRTAKETGIDVGTTSRSAAGSLSFSARPGYAKEIDFGGVILKDIPLNVGNPPPLVMTQARMAIGVDIMHHLRFIIDYPKKQVRVMTHEEADKAPVSKETWDIPLWTFAEHCLSQSRLPDGSFARTLIDSGNFATTLVWPEWGRQHMPNHRGRSASMLAYAFTNPQSKLEGIELGGRTLPTWPVMDMPPVTLQGVDLLDLLMGHDLLSQYCVEIDMRHRRLRLTSPEGGLKPPIAPRPMLPNT